MKEFYTKIATLKEMANNKKIDKIVVVREHGGYVLTALTKNRTTHYLQSHRAREGAKFGRIFKSIQAVERVVAVDLNMKRFTVKQYTVNLE